ncbi:SDR family oxidoreductase [Streptomycetaceae bacterium NBC_01309]
MTRQQSVALVTGSSSGIGAAVACRLAAEGMRVVVNSARSPTAGAAVAATLPGAIYLQADISDEEQAQRLVDDTLTQMGRLDVLVNNAAVTRFIDHRDMDAVRADTWRRLLDVNVIGAWQVTAAAIPHLERYGGSIVNISSQAGVRPGGSSIPYAVSKAAVNHMTLLLAETLAPGIRVNAVAPGMVDTPWLLGHPDPAAAAAAWSDHAPLGRLGRPHDVAGAVAFLAGAAYITGVVLLVDGGAHLR